LKLKFEENLLTLSAACTDSGSLLEASASTSRFEVSKKNLKVMETLEPIRSTSTSRCEAKMSGNFSFRIETDQEFVLISDAAGETRFTKLQ